MLQHLTFYSEKMFNNSLFSKGEGQTNQSRLFYACVNVHYVNVKPSIFDVIGRLKTTEYQQLSLLMSQVKAINTLYRRQKYRAALRNKMNNFDKLVDVNKETQRL